MLEWNCQYVRTYDRFAIFHELNLSNVGGSSMADFLIVVPTLT